MSDFFQEKRFRDDDAGAVTVLTALALVVIFGFGALAVDLGSFFYQKRRLQAATDLAAMAAATNVAKAQQAAVATLQLNGFEPGVVQRIETGAYVADLSTPAAQRFTPVGGLSPNAVRLTTQIKAPLVFGRVLQLLSTAGTGATPDRDVSVQRLNDVKITSHATAAQNALASFAIGSRLVGLNGGVLNAVLGGLLGANLSLSAMDYEALASANIDLFAFSNALATRAGLTAATYDQLASAEFKAGDLFGAALDAARTNQSNSATAITALSQIAAAAPTSTARISPLLSYGPYGPANVGSAAPISASVAALDLVSAIAQVANGTHQVEAAFDLGVPGVAAASLRLAIGERPVGSSWVAIGSTGASVHTAQTRLLLTFDLSAPGPTTVHAPVYLELASATANLTAISCGAGVPTSSSVSLAVTPAVVDAWIGAVSDADFTNFSVAANPGPATLLRIDALASVKGRAHAAIANLQPVTVSFSYSEILQMTKKTTSTTDFVSSLVSQLLGNLSLSVSAAGLGLNLPGGSAAMVANVISAATSPIDQAISQVLQTVGVGIGQADTWVSGVKCGGAVLVN